MENKLLVFMYLLKGRITCVLATGLAGEKIVTLFNITLTCQDFWTLKAWNG